MEICLLKICSEDFSFSWRCVYGDLSFWKFVQEIFPFEDLFRRFFPFLKICLGDFSFHEDVFMEICPIKIY